MSTLQRPQNWPDLAAGFVLDNLSDEELMIWRSLCAEDPTLLAEVQQLQQTFNQVADVIPLHAPSQQFVNHLRQQAHQEVLMHSGDRNPSISAPQKRGVWWYVVMVSGIGAIAFLGAQVYGLQAQVQQLKGQLLEHQSQLQTTNTQLNTVNRQLDQSNAQLIQMEQGLSQSQQKQEEMYQLLQQLTQESSVTP